MVKRRVTLNIFLALIATLHNLTANALERAFVSTLSPMIGSGQVSNNASVQNMSGIGLSAGMALSVTAKELISPQFEAANIFVATRKNVNGETNLARYDNRLLGARIGFMTRRLGGQFFATGGFGGGRAFTKLQSDQKSDTEFVHNNLAGITGYYFAADVGVGRQLTNQLAISLGVNQHVFWLKQSGAAGTYEGEQIRDGGSFHLEGTTSTDTDSDDRLVMKTTSATLALTLNY